MSLRTAREREELRQALERWLDIPLTVAAVVVLGLIIAELVLPLSPGWREAIVLLGTIIWLLFLVDFIVGFTLAISKLAYLRDHWLVAISVLLPFFRVLRIARIARLARPIWAARLATALNRAVAELGQVLRGRQFAYVAVVTIVVSLAGAAGIFFFERDAPASPFQSYPDALWYVGTIITNAGGERNPVTPEGRAVALLLMVIGVGLFGYITASVASYFVRKDVEVKQPRREVVERDLREMMAEMRLLRERLDAIYAEQEARSKERERRSVWDRLLPWR